MFVHDIDPVIGRAGGLYLWWYGLSYTLGYLGIFSWLKRKSPLGRNEAYSLTAHVALGVLVCGRLVEVFFYEWSYYGAHPSSIAAIWLGGMSTHGILLGAVLGTWIFCRRTGRSFFRTANMLAIPGAWVMGMGRLGNFIDGQIVGSVTDVAWGVQFPDAPGFRHPVVLYDGLKNLALIPFLLWVRRRNGPVLGHFLLWYGFLRIFIDFTREYRTSLLGFPPGQEFNVALSVIGTYLILRPPREAVESPRPVRRSVVTRVALVVLMLIPTIIPSDWTQDVPARYGKRHPGMEHNWLYPPF